MPSVSQVDSPPSSPRSPPRKRTKFSLKLKSKKKPPSDTREKLFPIFSPPTAQNTSDDDAFEPPIPPPPYSGLKNHGNICYANAVLQVLRHCPGLMQSVGEIDSLIRESCPTVENARVTETGQDKEGSEEIDLCSDNGEDYKSVACRLKELFSQMKHLELDYNENKENCEHLVQRRNYLILAAKPLDFMETFRKQNPLFEDNLQHDAQEFLCSLLVNLQDAENEIKKRVEDAAKLCNRNTDVENFPAKKSSSDEKSQCCSPLEDLFHGRLLHQTKCMTCEDAKKRFEHFQDISVPVQKEPKVYDAKKAHTFSPTPKKGQNSQSLSWALSQFATVEHLSGENKYFCENCLTHTEAEISTYFDKLPRILIIHLKRFTANRLSGFLSGSVSKITSNLETPMELSVKEWCSKSCPLTNPMYHLFGIVMHSGMTSCSGHYQAYVKVLTPNIADVNNNKQPNHHDNTQGSPSGNDNKVNNNIESSEECESQSANANPVGSNTFSRDDKSSEINQISNLQNSAEKVKTTCISGITKYFHKSRKHSTKEKTKMENVDEENNGDLPVAGENQRHHSTPTSSFTGKSLNKIQSFQYHGATSSRSAIRQLNFQDSNGQLDQAKECQNATNTNADTQTFQWIHFDDAEVVILEESDVSTLLSSSESSFTSPYLLFYKLVEP